MGKEDEEGGAMTKSEHAKIKERIMENLQLTLANIESNPLMENYTARNVESYLRSLEILERMGYKDE